jgi:hypothetical protein
MNLQYNIRRILREETQIPIHIRRRLKFGDTVDVFKKNSLRYMDERSVIKAIAKGANYTGSEMVPYDEDDDSYSWDEHGDITNILSEYLISEYGDEVREYLEKTLPEGSFDDDGFKYIFWRHSETHGGSGFSESYPTWGKLMVNKGWWFPINWWEVKSELDRLGQCDLTILKPGDKHNTMGYYFSIRKRKKD